MTTNDKGRTAGNRSTPKHDHGSIISSAWSAIAYRLWVMSYSVEEARQRYADRRQLLRQAGACLALALLRLAGMRNE
jgi:hypothetical protein